MPTAAQAQCWQMQAPCSVPWALSLARARRSSGPVSLHCLQRLQRLLQLQLQLQQQPLQPLQQQEEEASLECKEEALPTGQCWMQAQASWMMQLCTLGSAVAVALRPCPCQCSAVEPLALMAASLKSLWLAVQLAVQAALLLQSLPCACSMSMRWALWLPWRGCCCAPRSSLGPSGRQKPRCRGRGRLQRRWLPLLQESLSSPLQQQQQQQEEEEEGEQEGSAQRRG